MNRITVAAVAGLMVMAATPTHADHPVQVTMLVESFDGCGCTGEFTDPIGCAACPAGVIDPFPDCDVFGPRSLDLDWKNVGYASDMAGDSDSPAQGWAAQKFTIGDVKGDRSPNPSSVPFNAALLWIDYDNLASPSCGATSAQRFELETTRAARGLPPADPDAPAYFILAVRRDDLPGDGDTSDITTRIILDVDGMPTGSSDGPVWVDVLPGAGWQDVIVNNLPKYITRGRLHILVELKPDGNYVNAALGEKVSIKVDNVRYVYTGLVPDTETNCSNGFDDDMDGLTDCDDPDCTGAGNCPCNKIIAFDTDFDLDVDQADFGFLQSCFTGPGPNNPEFAMLSAACQCLDVTGAGGLKDNAIDQADLAIFTACASGPTIAAATACDD